MFHPKFFQPKIIAYLCTWCSYTGADTAGIARLKYPANLRAIRVPCSGRVSPELVLRTFDQGADGVLVLGCHIGECHYETGNHRAAKRLPILRALLGFAGLEPERLRLDWVSASEGERFARIVGEFTDVVMELGPAGWWVPGDRPPTQRSYLTEIKSSAAPVAGQIDILGEPSSSLEERLREKARQLLADGQVDCVIGYEAGTHGQVRPAYAVRPEDAGRLVWNRKCTHNLTRYLRQKLQTPPHSKGSQPGSRRVAVVVKPCDSRAINVLLAENGFSREQVYVIGVACDGVYEDKSGRARGGGAPIGQSGSQPGLQDRCLDCTTSLPVVYDTLIGETPALANRGPSPSAQRLAALSGMSLAERMEFWLSQFDRCLRCYACRQACPQCNCPTCLYEQEVSLWAGLGIRINEKRAFHLGRAFHLAGRCIGCDECERVCPVGIPVGLLNRKLAQEIETAFGFRAGFAPEPAPFVTVLGGGVTP